MRTTSQVIFEKCDKRQETWKISPPKQKANFSILDVCVKCLVYTMMLYNDILSVDLGVEGWQGPL